MNLEYPQIGICVDASTRGNPGISQYQIVDLDGKVKKVLSKKFYSTNNIAEFIGLCHAVHYCFENGDDNLFTDSMTALSWVKNGRINSNMARNRMTNAAWVMVGKSMNFIKQFKFDDHKQALIREDGKAVFLTKWFTSEWGEIPADFGNKS
jgi:ribonuclease HI